MPSSPQETGNAKNVSNFATLISVCTGYGAKYAPSNNVLVLKALNLQLTNGKDSLSNVNDSIVSMKQAVGARQVAFRPLKKLSTRIVNALAASGAGAEVIANAQSVNHKIQGTRAEPLDNTPAPPSPEPEKEEKKDESADDEKHISASQLSYDNQVDHFELLVKTVAAEPKYNPNEADLTVAALQTTLALLQSTNQDVIDALTDISNSRIARNTVLYDAETGIVATAFAVKKYVKSVFGATSPQYKQVSRIAFKTFAD
jgi:hypothetical protein